MKYYRRGRRGGGSHKVMLLFTDIIGVKFRLITKVFKLMCNVLDYIAGSEGCALDKMANRLLDWFSVLMDEAGATAPPADG